MGRVLVVGSSNTDLVCRAERAPRRGETVRGSHFETFPGGKGANQAVAAARAGASVRFVGCIGDDDFGRQRLTDLAADGIETAGVRVAVGVPSGVALIIVEASGDNSIVIVPGANDRVTPDAAREAIAARQHDVLSLTLEIPFETVSIAVAANLGRTPTVLNAAPFDARVSELLNAVDVLIVNEVEAGELLGTHVTPDNAADMASRIVRDGPRAVAITLGAHGVVLASESGVVHVSSPLVQVVDTTAAGDAFCGAMAAWLARNEPLAAAVRAGVAAGALAVSRPGAQPSLPSRQEIDALLAQMSDA